MSILPRGPTILTRLDVMDMPGAHSTARSLSQHTVCACVVGGSSRAILYPRPYLLPGGGCVSPQFTPSPGPGLIAIGLNV